MTPSTLLLFAYFLQQYKIAQDDPNKEFIVPKKDVSNEQAYDFLLKNNLIAQVDVPVDTPQDVPLSKKKKPKRTVVEKVYRITDRGVAYGVFLCQVPLPVQQWGIPHK